MDRVKVIIIWMGIAALVIMSSPYARAANYRQIQAPEKLSVAITRKTIDQGQPMIFHIAIKDANDKFSTVFQPCKIAVELSMRDSTDLNSPSTYTFVESNRIPVEWGMTSVTSTLAPTEPGIYRGRVQGCKLLPKTFFFQVRALPKMELIEAD